MARKKKDADVQVGYSEPDWNELDESENEAEEEPGKEEQEEPEKEPEKKAPIISKEPNRYGAQGRFINDDPCCCHNVPLTSLCSGCELLKKTNRQPTLIGA